MSSSWKDKFLPPKGVVSEVSGKDHTFYPVSVGRAVKLKALGGPLMSALTTLFSQAGRGDDVRKVVREFDATEQEPAGRESVIEEIAPALAELRLKQRDDAIDRALEAVTSSSNVGIVGDLIVDSMRELFPPGDKDNPPGIEIATWFNIVQMRQVLTGVAKANAEVFGPLAQKVTQAVEGVLQGTPGTTLTTPS